MCTMLSGVGSIISRNHTPDVEANCESGITFPMMDIVASQSKIKNSYDNNFQQK
jgi:hypothetical protein